MLNICIVGATGLVGIEMLNELENMELGEVCISLFATIKSKGKVIVTSKNTYVVSELNNEVEFTKFDIALFSAGKEVSKMYAPIFAKNNCYVIDNSSAFRREVDVPLLAMGVNLEDFKNYDSKIIANPNCSTIQSVIVLKQLSDKYVIKDIDYVTYQSVSGSGISGIQDLELTEKGLDPVNYPYPIYNNVIPQIDKFLEDGYTYEEEKMIFETRKILNIDSNISATCVRVPVKNSHVVQIRVEFESAVDVETIINDLDKQEHLQVLKNELPMPLMMKNKRHVETGRIRGHRDKRNVIFLMTVADNLKVGASTNACEIAKYLVENIINAKNI